MRYEKNEKQSNNAIRKLGNIDRLEKKQFNFIVPQQSELELEAIKITNIISTMQNGKGTKQQDAGNYHNYK